MSRRWWRVSQITQCVVSLLNPTTSVQFCGLTGTARPGGFDISVYDKRSSFPVHARNYPHSDSNTPRSILYSAFVGQLHRSYRLSSTPNAFRSCVKDMCRKLVKENGCRSLTLSHKLRSFIARTNWKYPTKRSRFWLVSTLIFVMAVETFTSLALDGKDWNRGTLLGAFDNTLSDAKRNSSRVSALLRQQFIDCIHHATAQQSLSVD